MTSSQSRGVEQDGPVKFMDGFTDGAFPGDVGALSSRVYGWAASNGPETALTIKAWNASQVSGLHE